ncbi:MAG TPA: invasin domain 3-containing protein, partial [Gemmatimonadaceae bacterium]|nr:invasin domain 3-containing protein [Gemmatimonadaceae bacterium]
MTHSASGLILRRVLPLMFAAACSGDTNGPDGGAGPVAAGQSQVSVSLASVASGASVALTLRALDARGRDVGRGGSSVVFAASGGTATGLVGPTTDLGNGSYEATFTGVIAGTATTIGATIDGAPVTTPLPVVRVKPGGFSPAQSTLTVTPRTLLPGGSATLELIARDAAGNQLETGGLDVTLQVSGGSSVGVIGTVTDHGDGRYTAPFTAGQVGTPLTVLAEVDGVPVASAPPTVTVAQGISLEHSVFSIPYDTITVNEGLRLTLQLRDSSNIARTTGGDNVQFIVTDGGDGGDGTISDLTDHDDGTYTANLTGTRSGTVLLDARINGRTKGGALLAVTIQPSPLTPQNSTVRVS